ncbi:beta-phosphoglucomutase [Mediterraneibacter sp. NSJ-55]|uniref:Beta-phosphoglucomutase n=1 Tax=Mediterraneibacter hominis TaxID=2763054 RepID=A0A923LLQ1_9FIRM|nr:beta-phosphoglucomutase [Mediterraneibacter hominis]MBC5690608.1 beta-phosphoglucomutase [Mediterraneibacter hominis]
MEEKIRGCIFDLDGVVVDTAKYHYAAWKKLADELGFYLSIEENEKLKGVSRMESLDIILKIGGIENCSQERKRLLAEKKNMYYLEMLSDMGPSEILPGIVELIKSLKMKGCRIALGSASKSAGMILKRLGIEELFDEIVDGNDIKHAKPHPEVFQTAAKKLGISYEKCMVVEDAKAGVEAAHACGMCCIGVGSSEALSAADFHVESTAELSNIFTVLV